jgi:hypothetical protein
MSERRSEPRMLCADLVDVRWKEKSGKTRRAVANLEDISHSGACIQVDEQIPLGVTVQVSYPKGSFSGEVRYCLFREIGYYVGLMFETGSKWSEKSFKPMHLFDPRTLARKAAKDPKPAPPVA